VDAGIGAASKGDAQGPAEEPGECMLALPLDGPGAFLLL
jgi:hypothetical protein